MYLQIERLKAEREKKKAFTEVAQKAKPVRRTSSVPLVGDGEGKRAESSIDIDSNFIQPY